jgi:hypothetical protein
MNESCAPRRKWEHTCISSSIIHAVASSAKAECKRRRAENARLSSPPRNDAKDIRQALPRTKATATRWLGGGGGG